jgi:NTE family protein
MLHALAAHGITADMVFGSSVGALNCAYYAGMPTIEGIKELEAIWRGLRRRDVFQVTWWTVLGFIQRKDFLATSEGLRRLIDKHLPYRNLEDAKIPVHIIATDILSGETVVLSKGSAAEAILASVAIPPAFAPVQFERLYLADGAITSNTPVKIAVECGAQRLIVLPTGYACALDAPPAGAVANALHALTLLIARQLLDELEHLDQQVDYFIVPPLCPLTGSPYDFSQTSTLIARAVESTKSWLADGGLERPRVHTQLSLHKHGR